MVWSAVWILAALISVGHGDTHGLSCEEASTPIPKYPTLHEQKKHDETWRRFTLVERRMSRKVNRMFYQAEVTRRCITWQKEHPYCWIRKECRVFACFGHLEGEVRLVEPETEFAVELYGYAQGSGWVATAFSNSSDTKPIKNAVQVECVRKWDFSVVLQLSYMDSAGQRTLIGENELSKYVRLIDRMSHELLPNHLYCKAYLKTKFEIGDFKFDFKIQRYYPILSVGERYDETGKNTFNLQGPCSMPSPEFPMFIYRIYEPSEDQKIYYIGHAWCLILALVFFAPSSIFAIRYLKFHQDNINEDWNMKEWLYNHLIYAIPVYPLIYLGVWFARKGQDYDQYLFQPNAKATFAHGVAGSILYQIFSIQFYLGLFSYPFLRIDTNLVLKRMHYLMNYFGYLLFIHLIFGLKVTHYIGLHKNFHRVFGFFLCFQIFLHFFMTFYHFILRLLPVRDENYYPHAHIPTFPQIILQGTREIQRQPFPGLQYGLWRFNTLVCFIFAITLCWMTTNTGPRNLKASRTLTTRLEIIGQNTHSQPYFWLYML